MQAFADEIVRAVGGIGGQRPPAEMGRIGFDEHPGLAHMPDQRRLRHIDAAFAGWAAGQPDGNVRAQRPAALAAFKKVTLAQRDRIGLRSRRDQVGAKRGLALPGRVA